ncbi:hypothetical protein [Parvularcula maris]|uniref:PEP-CTERM sorting domain-containing protein n=1 Tax=Parvularcula maris TaxID=2965077 RepID=A0A9X2LB55_9PROT|nr:hypothetical protein [Parvularcula maris]MCQ8186488.1 hypothetical protein [Parvularcula maris]
MIKTLTAIALTASASLGIGQAAIVNGDFSAGSTGFVTFEDGGTVSISGGTATLSTDAGLGADVLVASISQGDDGSFTFDPGLLVPSNAVSLVFDITQAVADVDALEDGTSFFGDSLQVLLADSEDLLLDVATFIEAGDVGSFTVDISSLQGRTVALFIDLFDEDDGFDTTFSIDNIAFVLDDVVNPIPLPGAFVFALTGFGGLLLRKRG